MEYVSVGQVENIQEAISVLRSAYDTMENACQAKIVTVEIKLEETRKEADNSARLLESAVGREMEAYRLLEKANEQLFFTQGRLNSAWLSLSACEVSGNHDEEGNYLPPDCSCEEADVHAAESDMAQAEESVSDTEAYLEAAKEHRMQMERRNELSRQCLAITAQLAETVRSECSERLVSTASVIEIGISRLENAKAALNAYLETSPPFAEFYSWLKWSPGSNAPITPKELHSRLNLSTDRQRKFLEYLSDTDSVFRAKITEYRNQLKAACGPVERHAVQLKIRRNLSGYCAEKIVVHALSPIGHKTDTQARTTFQGGRYTMTDLIIENLKVPVILGRGEGMLAPEGGSIAIEVKCGRSSYLYSQKDHMVFQSGGHKKSSASITVCSRDIKDLSVEQEEELREALRSAGSPLIGILPSKDEIDSACWEMVTNFNLKGSAYHENQYFVDKK